MEDKAQEEMAGVKILEACCFDWALSSSAMSWLYWMQTSEECKKILEKLGYRKPLGRPELEEALKFILEDKDAHFTSNWIVIKAILALIPEPTLNLPDMKDEEVVARWGAHPTTGNVNVYQSIIQAYKELIISKNRHLEVV